MTSERRWKILAEKLAVERELGNLGVVAASTGITEYKLHDLAKMVDKGSEHLPLSHNEINRLWKYFEGKSQ
jgi:hypothetical protein